MFTLHQQTALRVIKKSQYKIFITLFRIDNILYKLDNIVIEIMNISQFKQPNHLYRLSDYSHYITQCSRYIIIIIYNNIHI